MGVHENKKLCISGDVQLQVTPVMRCENALPSASCRAQKGGPVVE